MTKKPLRPLPDQPRDAGLTLVEMIVAMGIFSLLMVLVTTVFVQGLKAIANTDADAGVQQEQQNAMLLISRLLRFTDNPSEGSNPATSIAAASATGTTFYTYSGTGSKDGVPYKATLGVAANGDLTSTITTPSGTSGSGYTWPTIATDAAVHTRVLVRAVPNHRPTLALTYYDSAGLPLTPPANQSDAAAMRIWSKNVTSVRAVITDSSTVQTADQTVLLINPR